MGISAFEFLIVISGYVTFAVVVVFFARAARGLLVAIWSALQDWAEERREAALRAEFGGAVSVAASPHSSSFDLLYRGSLLVARARQVAWRLWWHFARLWWFAFVLVYVPTSLSNIYLLIADNGPMALGDPAQVAHAFRLDRLWVVGAQYPLLVVPALIVITTLIWLGRNAPTRRMIAKARREESLLQATHPLPLPLLKAMHEDPPLWSWCQYELQMIPIAACYRDATGKLIHAVQPLHYLDGSLVGVAPVDHGGQGSLLGLYRYQTDTAAAVPAAPDPPSPDTHS